MGPSNKNNRICHGFLQSSLAIGPFCDSEKPRSGNQTFIVTGKLHVLLLRADELKGRKVNSIQCPHGNREWLHGARQHWPDHFNHRNAANQIPCGVAMRILELMPVDPIPNLAFEKAAGHKREIPERVGRVPILCQ